MSFGFLSTKLRIGGIDLAECPAGELFVGGLVVDGRGRVDHDARDARLHRRRRSDPRNHRYHRAQSPSDPGQPQITHGSLLFSMRGNRRALASAVPEWIENEPLLRPAV
jgi:hypothetical protein